MNHRTPPRAPLSVALFTAASLLLMAACSSTGTTTQKQPSEPARQREGNPAPEPSPEPPPPVIEEFAAEHDKSRAPLVPKSVEVPLEHSTLKLPADSAQQFFESLEAKWQVTDAKGPNRGTGTSPLFNREAKWYDDKLLQISEYRGTDGDWYAHGRSVLTFDVSKYHTTVRLDQRWSISEERVLGIGYMRDGRMHGPWMFNTVRSAKDWEAAPVLHFVGEYDSGVAHGEFRWYDADGRTKGVMYFKGGKQEREQLERVAGGVTMRIFSGGVERGLYRKWNDEGQLVARAMAYKGRMWGKAEFWNPGDTRYYRVRYFKPGTDSHWEACYDKDGQLLDQRWIENNTYTGPFIEYHPGSFIKATGNLKNGQYDGVVYFKFKSRSANESAAAYKDGKRDGGYWEYFESGKLKVQANYKNDELDGPYKKFAEDGKLIEELVYENGKLKGPEVEWPQPTVVNGPDGKPIKRSYGRWRVETQDDGPPMVYGVAMAWHEKLGGVVMFGGVNSAEDAKEGTAETWLRKDGRWRRIFKDGPAPAARDYAAMAYDSARGVIVLFGGRLKGSAALSDTWELGVDGWKQFVTTPRMEGRKSASLVYDKNRQGCVLIGGVGKDPSGQEVTRSETYIWNGTEWKKLGVGPAVHSAAACYDEQRGCIVVHGGFEGGRVRADNWVLAHGATEWKQLKLSPFVAYEHAMVYDLDARTTVLLMKDGLSDPPRLTASVPRDYGSFLSWTEVRSLPQLYERIGFGAAYDRNTREIVIYGGRALKSGSWVGFKETLLLTDETREDRAADTADFARERLQAPGWSLIDNGDFAGSEFYHQNLVYDAKRKVAVMIGQHLSQSTTLEVYEFKDGAWKAMSPPNAPAVRAACACWYDAKRGVVRMFGGVYGKQSFADLWEWDGQNWTRETEQVPGAPRVTPETVWAWDPERRVLVGLIDAVDYCQVHEFDGKRWKDTGVRQPSGFGGILIFDPHKQMVLLSNPLDMESYSVLPKAWHWDGKSWLEAKDIMQGPDHDAGYTMHSDPVTGAIWQVGAYIRMFDGKEWKHWECPEGLDEMNIKVWGAPETGLIHVHGTNWFLKGRRNDTLVFDPEQGELVK